MNWLEIEQLLNRFWEGETTLAEEQVIKRAFLRDDVPEHLQSAQSYFAYLENQLTIQITDTGFESKVLSRLSPKRKFFNVKTIGYAAGLLILISSLFFLLKSEKKPAPQYTQLSQKEIEFVQKYMNLLATNLDQSLSFSAHNLQRLNLLDIGAQTIRPYEESLSRPLKNLEKVELINQSFDQLKPLKAFETIKIKL
ncbi:MAG: hypothetical protein JW857_02875 [Bacteroidales bacterium]|nr:hypothetical protein [Bacteroidales bacterium]